MASAPRPSSRSRQTWRERSRSSQPAVEGRLVQRWLTTIVLLLLVAALAWLIWQYFFAPRTHFANLSVARYDKHAVPAAPYFDNDSNALARTVECELLDQYETYESMRELGGELNRIVLRPRDSLVLYVSAHGASLPSAGGATGYLLCDDFDPLLGAASGGLSIKEFLEQVRACRARTKIVILDAGHLPTEPRLGMIVNEFPALLAEAVRDTKDDGLWVLSANSMHESSHVAHARGQSVFNHFVVRGLAGDADVSPDDDVVDLAELTAFVADGVKGWMKTQYGDLESQTPQILWGGGAIDSAVVAGRMRDIALPIPSPPPEEEEKKAPAAKPGDSKQPADASEKEEGVAGRRLPLRGGGDFLGRMRGQRGWGTLSLAAAGQSAAAVQDPTSDAKAAPDAPAAEAAPDEKSAEAKKTNADSKPEAADSKSPPGDEAGKKKAAQDSPGEADEARDAPAKQRAKKKVQEQEPAKPKFDPWSGVRAAWSLRNERQRSDLGGDWTAIDYGPRLWRRFESAILDYEARYRDRVTMATPGAESGGAKAMAGKKGAFQENPKEADELRSDQREFTQSRKPAETSGPIHDALRSRNRAVYRAIYLVAWHARASFAEQERLPEYAAISELLRELVSLDRSLAAAVEASADGAAEREADRAEALDTSRTAVEARLAAVEARLNTRARDALDDANPDNPQRGVARRIEDLLGLPLADASLRIPLLEALGRIDKAADKPKASRSMIAPPTPEEVIGRMRREAEQNENLKMPWMRAVEQAELETLLVEFADREAAKRLSDSFPRAADALESKRRQIHKLCGAIAQFYRDSPREINRLAASDLMAAERRLRLFPFATPDTYRVNPVLELHWSPPPVRGFDFAEFAATSPLVLDAAKGWSDVEGVLAARGDYTGEVRISVDYDPAKLEVIDASGTAPAPLKPGDFRDVLFEAGQPSLALRYRVRSAGLQPRGSDKLILKAEAISGSLEPKTCTIVCTAAPPERVELVIWPAASPDNPVEPSALADNLPLISSGAAGSATAATAWQVSAFPGHVTSFTFKLKHDSRRKRRVGVQLLGVAETDPERNKQLRAMADRLVAERSDELLKLAANPRSTVAQLAAVKEMKLGEADTEGVAISFSPVPPPAAAADGKAAQQPSDPATPPPSVAGGLVVVVNDLDDPRLGPWVSWIDLAPWAPWHYVEPRVEYDGQRLMVVDMKLWASARPLDRAPIDVIWEETADISQRDLRAPEVKLNRENDYANRLVAEVGRKPGKEAQVSLNVDGYPRAFIYRVALDDRRSLGKDDRLDNQQVIKIVRPVKNDAFRPGNGKLDIKIQATVPGSNFRSFGASPGDRVEVGVDKTGDGTIDILATSFTDRKRELVIDKIESDGRVAIATRVSDLEFELPVPSLNQRARLVARLYLDGNPTRTDDVEVVFDQSRPVLEVAGSGPAVVHKGEALNLQIMANDQDSSGTELSGVKSVSYLVDRRRLDAEGRKSAKTIDNPDRQSGKYLLSLEPEDLALGTHNLLLWATDNVGLESAPEVVTFEVKPKRPMADKSTAMAKKGTIKGQVTYASASVSRATVAIVEGTGMAAVVKKTTVSDANGSFTFKDLDPGTYNLQAEGRARNGLRKAPSTPVTVPAPGETVSVTIKLQ